jgi:hypothetical protein
MMYLLAHLAKGNVSFCHQLASAVCRSLTFHILIFSSETPKPNEVAKGFQRRRFLEIDQLETRIACGGHVC